MSSEVIRYGGTFGLPLPPLEQTTVDEPITLTQLMTFEYPPVQGDAYDTQAFVRQRWGIRKALLNSIYLRLTQARNPDLVIPEHLTVAAGILHWLSSFEQWLSLSFLRGGV